MKKIAFLLILGLFISSPSYVVKAAAIDSDHDGLVDEQEAQFKTDIHNPDSDGDGFVDGLEVASGYNPASKDTRPLTKSILIDLKKQRLYQQLNNITIRTHTVSTGKASTPTTRGTYQIANKSKRAWSRSYGLWMPYWLGIKGTRMGIHELPEWPNGYKEGAKHLGIPVSHGCIRLGIEAAKIVYDWTDVGTKVTIK